MSGQVLRSGNYETGLLLAYDSTSNKLTGYFEGSLGWDDELKLPKFSCVFYIVGKVKNGKAIVSTYYPEHDSGEIISGVIEIISESAIKIKLEDEHGGCWNVQHFADEPMLYQLEKAVGWNEIKYVTADKAYLYQHATGAKKGNAYVVRNDFVCIEAQEGYRVLCTFYGEKISKGWVNINELNQ